MLRLLAFFLLCLCARAQEAIPLSSVVAFVPNADGYWTLVTTHPAPPSTATAPLTEFWVDTQAGLVWVGTAGSAMALAQQGSRPAPPQNILEATWVCQDGTQQRVVTPCSLFQDLYSCVFRHREMVLMMQGFFPPRT